MSECAEVRWKAVVECSGNGRCKPVWKCEGTSNYQTSSCPTLNEMRLDIFMNIHETHGHGSWVKSDSICIFHVPLLDCWRSFIISSITPHGGHCSAIFTGNCTARIVDPDRIHQNRQWIHLTSHPFWINCQWFQISDGDSRQPKDTQHWLS